MKKYCKNNANTNGTHLECGYKIPLFLLTISFRRSRRFAVDASSCLQNGLLQIEVNAVALIQGWTWQHPVSKNESSSQPPISTGWILLMDTWYSIKFLLTAWELRAVFSFLSCSYCVVIELPAPAPYLTTTACTLSVVTCKFDVQNDRMPADSTLKIKEKQI